MKHEHRWQFVREIDVDMFTQVVWKVKEGTYFKFVCDCGLFKIVKSRGENG